MSTLPYQNRCDHLRQRVDAARASAGCHIDAWANFATRVGGHYRLINSAPSVTVIVDRAAILLRRESDLSEHSGPLIDSTELAVAMPLADRFDFWLYPAGLVSRVARALRLWREFDLGDADFRRRYVLHASDVRAVRALFADLSFRDRFDALPKFYLGTRPATAHVDGPRELVLSTPGIITDVERLTSMLDLFIETLRRVREACP
jgi:hypothetical protein